MNDTDAKTAVKIFAGLYPTSTETQWRALRDELTDPADPRDGRTRPHALATLADAEAAIRAQILRTPYATDAIVGIFKQLGEVCADRGPKLRTTVEATREQLESYRQEAEAAERQFRLDDQLLAETPPDVLDRIANAALRRFDPELESFYRAKGFLGRRCWRALTAARLREEQVNA